MRRLTTDEDPERGAVAVIVAILMVVLLGFAALAVDIGLLYSERAQLQNGADAAALSIAQKCAKDETDTNCSSPMSLAKGYADSNSLDGLSDVRAVNLDLPDRRVIVTAESSEAGRTDNKVSLYFANILGVPASAVVATSTVVWGSPSKGITPFPLTMSVCQVNGMIDGAIQLIRSHSSNENADCPAGPSGSDTPGGFGWLAQDPNSCGAYIDMAIHESFTNTGNDSPSYCNEILNGWAADITAGKDVIVLLPVFTSVSGTGANSSYDVAAFAAFKVTGWKFAGSSDLPLTFRNRTAWAGPNACSGECRGIIGSFVEYVALSSAYEELGPVSPYGATVVKLTN